MSKPIVARLDNGEEYGFASREAALKLHPDATIVRYQDGTSLEELIPEPITDEQPDADPSRLSREELNQLAASLGIESPETLPNKAVVLAAIKEAQAAE